MTELPDNPSESFKRRNPHIYGTTAAAHNAPLVGSSAFTAKPGKTLCQVFADELDAKNEKLAKESKRIRQSSKPLLNKLELNFYAWLLAKYPRIEIYKQALRWRLGNGIWYKPDFAAFAGWTQKPTGLTCWEVKGPHAFRGGFENLKVAASLYQDVNWILVWREDGKWNQQEVLP